MNFAEYQAFASRAIQPETQKREPILAFALGLIGETGEVVDLIKKKIYYGREIDLDHASEELGDVLWYLANIASELGLSLNTITDMNKDKLERRYKALYRADFAGAWEPGGGPEEHEPIIGRGMYEGKQVVFALSGPHIKMYEEYTHKYIKFISKEEAKKYGITKSSGTGGSQQAGNAKSAGSKHCGATGQGSDNPPW